ncbi:FHA domain-containing protein [Pseudomonas sp. S75]|uniref:FHA domain-containing protein n=1 Tax=unclassified Pseudomonas TaxID=196821 RepID=UPI0019077227|nr:MULTISPECIES: FHA domain-containing protein [unclassified Pseudomonas]MBJ9978453.1 FHA domain-containing protein [Pseudomonas sp. S30]MBK0156426.1 FHA domain-containing protein [Pseudomonas sp. S75]
MSTLILSITNLDQLQHNVTARHEFDRSGGTVGSAGATWLIDDREHGVAPIHCEIRWIEGSFCVIDRCERTYLNDNLESLRARSPRRLREGDRLDVGAYRLLAELSHADSRSLEELFNADLRVLDRLILDTPAQLWLPKPTATAEVFEICSVFDPGMGNDPLAALEAVPRPLQESPVDRLIAGEPS